MFCNSCGSKLRKGDKVCAACGAPADQGEACGGFWGIISAPPVPAPAPAPAPVPPPSPIKQPGVPTRQTAPAPVIKEQPRHVPAAPVPRAKPVKPKKTPVLWYALAGLLALLVVLLVWNGILHGRIHALREEIAALQGQQETTEPRQATTVPETTVPETTVPETTVPETTVPETTVPEPTADPAEKTDVPPETQAETVPENTLSTGDQASGETLPEENP